MTRKERIEETLNAGLRHAEYKAFLPWNQVKEDWRNLSIANIMNGLENEYFELKIAIDNLMDIYNKLNEKDFKKKRRDLIANALGEVGDVINYAAMIADFIEFHYQNEL